MIGFSRQKGLELVSVTAEVSLRESRAARCQPTLSDAAPLCMHIYALRNCVSCSATSSSLPWWWPPTSHSSARTCQLLFFVGINYLGHTFQKLSHNRKIKMNLSVYHQVYSICTKTRINNIIIEYQLYWTLQLNYKFYIATIIAFFLYQFVHCCLNIEPGFSRE